MPRETTWIGRTGDWGVVARVLFAATLVLAWCARVSDVHAADDAKSTSTASAPREPESAPGVRRHDGLQLRAAFGGGYLRDHVNPRLFGPEGTASGGSVATLLQGGYTIRPHLALGGYFGSESVTRPTVTVDGQPLATSIEVGTLLALGAYVDWYPDYEGGFHLGGGLGVGNIRVRETSGDRDESPAGVSGFGLVGYDLWVADQWSVGAMFRFTAAAVVGDWVTHSVAAYSLLLGVTFH